MALTKASKRGRALRLARENTKSHDFLNASLLTCEIYLEFYSLVNHNAPWDVKLKESWNTTIGTPFPGENVEVQFYGNMMTPEMLGNFTYGYLGYSYGIPLDILIAGSYYAAGFPRSGKALTNEILDWASVWKGYFYASNCIIEGDWI